MRSAEFDGNRDLIMRSDDNRHSGSNRDPNVVRRGFSLVELLTVIFIISLLIAILIPSLHSARNAAKKTTTSKTLEAIKVGLEMFKNDNGSDFAQTNGYPPSFEYPPIPGYTFNAKLGEFPFLPGNPKVNGAHWLAAMLMGVDQLGYVKRSSVPAGTLRAEPFHWYQVEANQSSGPVSDRSPMYLDPGGTRTLKTRNLPGRSNPTLFPGLNDPDNTSVIEMADLPVIVDAFDQPILYYVASTHGKETNMVADVREASNTYTGGPQQEGTPYYFHEDNKGFTGTEAEAGWEFGNSGELHPLAVSGAAISTADEMLATDEGHGLRGGIPFARYILDRKLYSSLKPGDSNPKFRPVNADSYLLISASVDGRFGTADDVSNLPPFTER